MANIPAVIYQFFNGFGIPAYAASSVPDDAVHPYITYDLTIGGWNDGDVLLTADLWDRTASEAGPNAKIKEISRAVSYGGRYIPCDEGAIWIKRGVPWCQSVVDTDDAIKRRHMNFLVEFITC